MRDGPIARVALRSTCGWCGRDFERAPRGRRPKWCSQSCRKRAWEQRRAADAGLASVDVVDRVVIVERGVPELRMPRGPEWIAALEELARQIDTGRLYDRDLRRLGQALYELAESYRRRTTVRL